MQYFRYLIIIDQEYFPTISVIMAKVRIVYFSCDRSSICDNVCPSVCRSVALNNNGLSEVFQKLSQGSETLDMTSEGLGQMFEGDSADTGAGKFPLVSMGDRAEGLACADPGARTPIGASGINNRIIPLIN